MPLVECTDCQQQISEQANSCPNCGKPRTDKPDIKAAKEEPRRKFWTIHRLPVITLAFLFAFAWYLALPFGNNEFSGFRALAISLDESIGTGTILFQMVLPEAIGMMLVGWLIGWMIFGISKSKDWLFRGYLLGCCLITPLSVIGIMSG